MADLFDALTESSVGVTTAVLGPDLRVRRICRSWAARHGVSPAVVVGRPVEDVLPPAQVAVLRSLVADALAGRPGAATVEPPPLGAGLPALPPPRGAAPLATAAVHLTAVPFVDADGTPTVLCTVRDLSVERRRSRRLADSERTSRALIDSTTDVALVMLTPAGLVRSWNAGAERFTGWTAEQVVGQHVAVFSDAPDREQRQPELVLHLARCEGRHEEEGWRLRADGDRFWAQVVVTALVEDDGTLAGFSMVVRDLTEQRRLRAELAAREEMFRAAFDDAPCGTALIGVDATGRCDVLEANAALAALLGEPLAALLRQDSPLLVDRAPGGLHAALLAGDDRVRGVVLRRADGTPRSVVVRISPLGHGVDGDDGAGGRRVVVQFDDVTVRRQAEDAMAEALAAERRAGEEVRELERLRSDFLATVSHELRTPLASVQGYAELLAGGDFGTLSAPQERAVARITRNAARLSDLIGDLLVMASIEADSLPVRRRPTAVDDLVGSTLATCAPELAARGQWLDAGGDHGLHVEGDAGLLTRVLSGLIGNAAKFSPAGARVDLDVSRDPGWVTLAVRDGGIGIAAGDLDRVFDRFYRSSRSEQLSSAGTGLGLSLVKHIVEAHGGSISVSSTAGVGSCFAVRLPELAAGAAPGPAGGLAAADDSPAGAAGGTGPGAWAPVPPPGDPAGAAVGRGAVAS